MFCWNSMKRPCINRKSCWPTLHPSWRWEGGIYEKIVIGILWNVNSCMLTEQLTGRGFNLLKRIFDRNCMKMSTSTKSCFPDLHPHLMGWGQFIKNFFCRKVHEIFRAAQKTYVCRGFTKPWHEFSMQICTSDILAKFYLAKKKKKKKKNWPHP